jgi:HEAT repeat protein
MRTSLRLCALLSTAIAVAALVPAVLSAPSDDSEKTDKSQKAQKAHKAEKAQKAQKAQPVKPAKAEKKPAEEKPAAEAAQDADDPELAQLKAKFAEERSKDAYLRVETILKFGDHPSPGMVTFLSGILKEEKVPGIVGAVIQALGKVGSLDAVKAIFQDGIPVLLGDINMLSLAVALQKPLDEDAEEWILSSGITDAIRKDKEAMKSILEALIRFKTEKKLPFLQNELKRATNPEAKVISLHAFRDAKTKGAAKVVLPLLKDPDLGVQVAVLQVLEAVQAKEYSRDYIKLLKSKEWQVRVMGVDLLAMCRHPEIVRLVEPLLKDPENRVRITAVQVLEAAGGDSVMNPLIKALDKSEGRVLDDIADALARLTGKNFGPNPAQWDSWWSANKGKVKVERRSATDFARLKQGDSEQKTMVYFGLRVISKNIAFVIDTSGSMSELYELPEDIPDETAAPPPEAEPGKTVARNPKGAKKSGSAKVEPKIDVAKKELAKVLEGLPAGVRINIIRFSSTVEPWKPNLTLLDKESRGSASKFVEDGKPAGETNLYGALEEALKDEKLDTIYLLSDGAPNMGTYAQPADILAQIHNLNQLRKVKINTIGFGLKPVERVLMEDLAEKNYGVFLNR